LSVKVEFICCAVCSLCAISHGVIISGPSPSFSSIFIAGCFFTARISESALVSRISSYLGGPIVRFAESRLRFILKM
jgi:hypothetical protein